MARAGLTATVVTGIALEVLDQAGPAGLTLKAVARRAGVAPPWELAAGYQMPTAIDDSFAVVVDLLADGLAARARDTAQEL